MGAHTRENRLSRDLLTRGAISYGQTHWVLTCSLSLRTAVCSAAFPFVFSFQDEDLSVNQDVELA